MDHAYPAPCLTLHTAWVSWFRTTPAVPNWIPHAIPDHIRGHRILHWLMYWNLNTPWNSAFRAGSDHWCGSGVCGRFGSVRCLRCTLASGYCQRNVVRGGIRSHGSNSGGRRYEGSDRLCGWMSLKSHIDMWMNYNWIWYINLQLTSWRQIEYM